MRTNQTKSVFSGARVALTMILLAFSFATAVLAPHEAQACRDCPFPMKIGEGRWMMPNEKLIIQVEETRRGSRSVDLVILLKDATTGEDVAKGQTIRHLGRKSIRFFLTDREGGKIKGQITWVDSEKGIIQAKFACIEKCAIGDVLN